MYDMNSLRVNPSDCIMALSSPQPLTEISTRGVSWKVKAAGAYSLHLPIVLKSSMPQPPGTLGTCTGL